MLLANQFGDEDVVALGNIALREGVESSSGRYAAYSRSLGAPLHRQIAAAPQLVFYFDQMILRAFERRPDRVLFGVICAQARSQELVHAFEVRSDDRGFTAGNAPTDAPSGG